MFAVETSTKILVPEIDYNEPISLNEKESKVGNGYFRHNKDSTGRSPTKPQQFSDASPKCFSSG